MVSEALDRLPPVGFSSGFDEPTPYRPTFLDLASLDAADATSLGFPKETMPVNFYVSLVVVDVAVFRSSFVIAAA